MDKIIKLKRKLMFKSSSADLKVKFQHRNITLTLSDRSISAHALLRNTITTVELS